MNKLYSFALFFGVIILFIVLLCSCNTKKYPVSIKCINGMGYSSECSRIYCDSVQMISISEAYVWIDGTKIRVVASTINIQTTY